MKAGKNHIDRIFYKKLKNYSQEPPADVWWNVSGELNRTKRRKGMVIFARIAASMALIAILSISYFLVRNNQGDTSVPGEQLTVEQSTPEALQDDPGENTKEMLAEENIIPEPDENQVETDELDRDDLIADRVSQFDDDRDLDDQAIQSESEARIIGESRDQLDMIAALITYQLDYNAAHLAQEQVLIAKYTRETPDFPVRETDPVEEFGENLLAETTVIENKWGVGTQVSPLYSYRNLGIEESSTMAPSNYYDQIESGMISYAGGVHVNYKPAKRLTLQSGIYYSKLGLSVDHDYFIDNMASPASADALAMKSNQISNSSGEIFFGNGEEIDYVTNYDERRDQASVTTYINELNVMYYEGEIIQHFEYLEVPMVLRYRLIDKKLGFNLLGGLSTNFLIGSNAYFRENDSKEKIGKTTNIKQINYSSIVGISFDYAITRRLNINLEPTFRYYLNSINDQSAIKSHPYSLGLFTGLIYYF